VQVVDLTVARERFDAVLAVGGEASTEYWRMLTLLGTTGQSVGQEAIVQTVFLDTGIGQMSMMMNLAVTT
jgi:hypothetical protein